MPESPQTSPSPRIAFVRSCWHDDIVKQAERGFLEAIGMDATVESFQVPGAFELPLHVRLLAETGRFDAIVAAGLVVDGGIYRHEFVADAVIGGLMRVQLDLAVPVFSCVLTPQQFHEHQAHHRFFHGHMLDKGREVARACLATLEARAALSNAAPVRASSAPSIAVIDTTFARIDMGGIVAAQIAQSTETVVVDRVTVPGFKDLAAAARRAINDGAAIVVACAMPGPEPIDEACAHDASIGLQTVQALTGTPILEVFVHMTEALDDHATVDEDRLMKICKRRCQAHADNAIWMLLSHDTMTGRAGTGRRQGADDEGRLAAAGVRGAS